MDDCRSIGGLFENTTGLKEINIRGWSLDPTKITTDKALSSLVNLERIIVDNGAPRSRPTRASSRRSPSTTTVRGSPSP